MLDPIGQRYVDALRLKREGQAALKSLEHNVVELEKELREDWEANNRTNETVDGTSLSTMKVLTTKYKEDSSQLVKLAIENGHEFLLSVHTTRLQKYLRETLADDGEDWTLINIETHLPDWIRDAVDVGEFVKIHPKNIDKNKSR